MSALTKIFGTHSERELKRIYPIADKVESYRDAMQALSDEELRNKTKEYKERLEKAGLICSGTSPNGQLVEIVELKETDHPYFIAGQFHPELKSRPNKPAPLFVGLVEAAKKTK